MEKIDRRHFFGAVGTAFIVGLAAYYLETRVNGGVDTAAQSDTEHSSTPVDKKQSLIELLANKFKIDLLPANKVLAPMSIFQLGQRGKTLEWGEEDLKLLVTQLESLPPHFYQPRVVEGMEKRLHFGLMAGNNGEYCSCHFEGEQIKSASTFTTEETNIEDIIILGQEFLRNQPVDAIHNVDDPTSLIYHEYVHRVVNRDIGTYVKLLIEPITNKNTGFREQYFPNIVLYDEPWPVSFDNLTPQQRKRLEDSDNFVLLDGKVAVSRAIYIMRGEAFIRNFDWWSRYLNSIRDGEIEYLALGSIDTRYDLTKGRLGYGTQNFEEFFGVASEFYIKGKNRFIGTYQPYLGQDKTESLYEGIKEYIFEGAEYPDAA